MSCSAGQARPIAGRTSGAADTHGPHLGSLRSAWDVPGVPRVATRNRHQERALGIIGHLVADGELAAEVGVPRAAHRIDGIVDVGHASRGWGPIRSHVGQRSVVVEHFSRPPSLCAFTRSIAKLAWVVDDFWRGRPPASARPPLLLALSYGKPRAALARLPQLRSSDPPAVWLASRAVLGDILLVDIRRLPADQPGMSVLRLMAIPKTKAQADAGIAALLSDPCLVQSDVQRLVEALMERTIPTTEEEQRSIVEKLRDEGRQQGLQQGRQQGLQQGRDHLLAVAAKLLGVATAQQLAAIDDLDELEQRLVELLARRDDARE